MWVYTVERRAQIQRITWEGQRLADVTLTAVDMVALEVDEGCRTLVSGARDGKPWVGVLH